MPQPTHVRWSTKAVGRMIWAIISVFLVQSLLVGVAALPTAVFYQWHLRWDLSPWWLKAIALGAVTLPAYMIFAHLLMFGSAFACRALGWRPQPNQEWRISELSWPLLSWVRYSIISHVVRLLAGTALRATPMWTWYLKADGARIGRRVWVNSLGTTDHCLLDFGDDVVIGAGAHLSGHTVEAGVVRTAPIVLGAASTIGVNSIVGIGVVAGVNCQVGALSFVPKFSQLEADTSYGGVPVRPVRSGP